MNQFNKILVAVDFSENSDLAFDYALNLARQFKSSLTLIHVINEPVDLRGFYVPHISFEQLEQEIEQGAEQMMEKFCKEHLADFTDFSTITVTGIPYEEIIKAAGEIGASLIVVGTHGRKGFDHLIFGSTAERVVRNSPIPVLSVRLPVSA